MPVQSKDAERDLPPFPQALDYLWRCYIRLRRRVAPGFAGAAPVSWQDIDAFMRRAGIRLAPWEVELLERVDDLLVYPGETKPKAARRMTEQLFDTMFR